ncbi:MAG: hypothetical protein LBT01_04645 [Spirochaetaceae bacterium]|nr:hypothetical protein [Spirochaetaceae bacterium]
MPSEALSPAAAYFLASIAVSAIRVMRKENMSGNVGDEEQGGQEILIAIGTHASSSAKSGGFGAPATDIKTLVAAVRAAAGKFEVRSMYGVFLEKICSALSQSLSECEQGGGAIAYRNALKEAIEESRLAVEIYNQSIELALERLAQRLIDCFAKAGV